ncbi:MAG: hypothetical protein ACOH5I_14390 [Oligoflexus sp.]
MPLIEIQALPQAKKVNTPEVLTSLAQSVGQALSIPSQAVRCVWQDLQPGYYAEGLQIGELQPENSHPILVKVLLFEGRPQELIEQALQTVADNLQTSLQMSAKNFFISYYEAKSGQLFVGGQLKR